MLWATCANASLREEKGALTRQGGGREREEGRRRPGLGRPRACRTTGRSPRCPRGWSRLTPLQLKLSHEQGLVQEGSSKF